MCKCKDICFHTNDDIEELEALKLEDVVRSDKNGLD